jgi:hypothetical protein
VLVQVELELHVGITRPGRLFDAHIRTWLNAFHRSSSLYGTLRSGLCPGCAWGSWPAPPAFCVGRDGRREASPRALGMFFDRLHTLICWLTASAISVPISARIRQLGVWAALATLVPSCQGMILVA